VEIRERVAILACTFAVLLVVITPAAVGAEGSSLIPGLSPAKGPYDLGIIFNMDDLLLGLKS
jgi:hypothetical protein